MGAWCTYRRRCALGFLIFHLVCLSLWSSGLLEPSMSPAPRQSPSAATLAASPPAMHLPPSRRASQIENPSSSDKSPVHSSFPALCRCVQVALLFFQPQSFFPRSDSDLSWPQFRRPYSQAQRPRRLARTLRRRGLYARALHFRALTQLLHLARPLRRPKGMRVCLLSLPSK